jgi:hypothetical protein
MARGWRRGGVWFSLVAALTLLLAACGPAVDTPEACALVRKAELPVRFVGNLPVVEVKVNGRRASMVLDTGGFFNNVNKRAAQSLHLRDDWNQPVIDHSTLRIETGQLALDSDAEVAAELPMPSDFLVFGEPTRGLEDIDGRLGRDVLQNFDLDLDFPHDRVVLYQARHCPSSKPEIGVQFRELPHLSIAPSGPLRPGLVVVGLDGFLQTALINTGTSISTVDRNSALQMGLTEATLNRDEIIMGASASGSDVGLIVHRFHRLELTPWAVDAPLLAVMPFPDLGRLPPFDMILGNDFLRFHRIWLSLASGKAYGAVPPSREASAAPP